MNLRGHSFEEQEPVHRVGQIGDQCDRHGENLLRDRLTRNTGSACIWRVLECGTFDVWCVTRGPWNIKGLGEAKWDTTKFIEQETRRFNPVSERAAWSRKGQPWVKATTDL